jgi:hypothetical protein
MWKSTKRIPTFPHASPRENDRGVELTSRNRFLEGDAHSTRRRGRRNLEARGADSLGVITAPNLAVDLSGAERVDLSFRDYSHAFRTARLGVVMGPFRRNIDVVRDGRRESPNRNS